MTAPGPNPSRPWKILVTGATGFVGSHALDLLLARDDVEVHATRRWASRTSLIDHIDRVDERVAWHVADLTDPFSVDGVVAAVRPDRILHLGAQSFVSPSWDAPDLYLRTNALGTLYVLEAIRRNGLEGTRILLPGSGEEYGDVAPGELPIRPETPLRPVNPYAVSKVAQDLLGYEHWRSYGIHVVRVRAFNHEGPRRDRVFALPSFAYQIARIERGLAPPVVQVGNLDALRNWTDVRDMVRAYWLALDCCPPGELFLVGSDDVRTVRQCLEFLLSLSPAGGGIRIETVPRLVRPTEPLRLVADTAPFRKATGWSPAIPFEETLRNTLDYWRDRVGRERA
jgi:GDP-4-dehydro-6-deoxy-D-mannose reductase